MLVTHPAGVTNSDFLVVQESPRRGLPSGGARRTLFSAWDFPLSRILTPRGARLSTLREAGS
jgi:hypothetical protein